MTKNAGLKPLLHAVIFAPTLPSDQEELVVVTPSITNSFAQVMMLEIQKMLDVETRGIVWETTLQSYKIIRRKRQLQSLALAPIIFTVTTLVYVTIHNVRGSCRESDEIREHYPDMEVISFYMCCMPEWSIGAAGYCITGLLGMFSLPYICQSKLGFGQCWCCHILELFDDDNEQGRSARQRNHAHIFVRGTTSSTDRNSDNNGQHVDVQHEAEDVECNIADSDYMNYAVAACVASICISIAGASIFTECSFPTPHLIFGVLIFVSGTALALLRLCSVERDIVISNLDGDSVNSDVHVHVLLQNVQTLRYLSKVLRFISFLCFVSSFCLIFVSKKVYFIAQALAGFVAIFAIYSVVCELIIGEMITVEMNFVNEHDMSDLVIVIPGGVEANIERNTQCNGDSSSFSNSNSAI